MIGNFNISFVCAALLLGGCSSGLSGLLGGGDNKLGGPEAIQSIPVGNQLALPPDLSLPTPGQSSAAYQPNTVKGAPVTNVFDDASLNSPVATPRAPAAQGDIYDQNNISKLNPDGSKKDPAVLAAELKTVLLAKKRRQNPKYGTIFNIGGLFDDQ